MKAVEKKTQEYLTRAQAENPKFNAYLEIFPDALEQAKKVDDSPAGELPLAGQIIAVKDNILIEGKVASAASKILHNYLLFVFPF